jgi:hypothetical protein
LERLKELGQALKATAAPTLPTLKLPQRTGTAATGPTLSLLPAELGVALERLPDFQQADASTELQRIDRWRKEALEELNTHAETLDPQQVSWCTPRWNTFVP